MRFKGNELRRCRDLWNYGNAWPRLRRLWGVILFLLVAVGGEAQAMAASPSTEADSILMRGASLEKPERPKQLDQRERPVTLAIVNSYGDEISGRLFSESITAIRRAIAPKTLEVKIYGPDDFLAAADAGRFDVSIASSGLSSLMISRTNGIPLLSIATDLMPDPNMGNGSTIIVRADRTDIQSLEDLRGRTVAIMSRTAFAGWQIPLTEMIREGIAPMGFFGNVEVTGAPMTKIVDAVREGRVDAGFLLTCLLENLEETGQFARGEFKILNEHHHSGVACRHSSALYPNWLFTVKPSVTSRDARAITNALLDLPPGRTGIHWTVPTDHRRIYTLFETLNMPLTGSASTAELLRHWWPWIIGGFLFVLGLAGHSALLALIVRRRTAEAEKALREKMASDLAAKETTMRLEALQKASAVGLVSGMVAHELKQPLTVINNYAGSILQRLSRGKAIPEKTLAMAMDEIVHSGMTASAIVERIRSYAKSDASTHNETDVISAVRKCVRRLEAHPGYERKLTLTMPADIQGVFVDMDALELQLVVSNLIRNAVEALKGAAEGRVQIQVTLEEDSLGEAPRQKEDGIFQYDGKESQASQAKRRYVTISVKDNGTKISDEAFNRIGDVGYTTKTSGLGLGVAIICSLLEVHGGTLEFQRLEPQGVAAIVRLECKVLAKNGEKRKSADASAE